MRTTPLSPTFVALFAALLLTALQLPASRFSKDDWFQIATLEGISSFTSAPWNLYMFVDGGQRHTNEGPVPWYATAKVTFFRPLSSGLLALDHKVFGLNSLGYSVHTILWYLATIASLGLLVGRVLRASEGKRTHPAAYLALVIFAVAANHWATVMYIAARYLLVTTTLALLGLVAHMKWREEGWRHGRFLSPLLFILALLASEAALAVMAYLAAYELFGASGPLKKRLAALSPTVILVSIYLVGYSNQGFDTSLTTYTHPFTQPLLFIKILPLRFFEMASRLLVGQEKNNAQVGLIALVLLILLLYPALRSTSHRPRIRVGWMLAGMVGSMLPFGVLISVETQRHMIIPFIGGSILIAFILHYWWMRMRQFVEAREERSVGYRELSAWLGGLLCAALVCIHLILGIQAWFSYSQILSAKFEAIKEFHQQSALEFEPNQKAVFLNTAPNWLVPWFYGYFYRKSNRLPMPEVWWLLSTAPYDQKYHRTAVDKLELEIINGRLTLDPFRAAKKPLRAGEVIQIEGFQATILAVDEIGPTRIEFKFDRPLDDESYRFIASKGWRLTSVTVPPVGGSMLVARN